MTMFKQLMIIFSFIFLMLLIGVLGINFENSKEYIQKDLYVKAQNTASSLAISMSQTKGNITMMSTMANAVFDMGYYKRIFLEDLNHKILFDKKQKEKDGVPSWFKKLINIHSTEAIAQVSNGWNQIGLLHVVSSSGYAYKYLYNTVNKILTIFVIVYLIGIIILAIALKVILKPLLKVKEQAKEVLNNKFIYQDKLPSTLELKVATKAINDMVRRMENMHKELIKEAKAKWELEYLDKITGIGNRKLFFVKYKDYIEDLDANTYSCMDIFKINNLEMLNNTIGYKQVDKMIKDLLKFLSVGYDEMFRMSASEFLAINVKCKNKDYEDVIEKLKNIVNEYVEDSVDAGICIVNSPFKKESNISHLLSLMDLNLNKIITQGGFRYIKVKTDILIPLSKKEWIKTIDNAFKNESVIPKYYSIYDIISEKKMDKIKLNFDIKTKNNQIISYSDYAVMMKILNKIDIYIDYFFSYIEKNTKFLSNKEIVLEIFIDYLNNIHGFEKIVRLAKKLKKEIKSNIILEIKQNEFLSYDISDCDRLVDRLNEQGISIGIANFNGDKKILDRLQYIRPKYIRIYADIFLQMSDELRKSLYLLTQNINTTLLISDIGDDNELSKIKSLKFNSLMIMQKD